MLLFFRKEGLALTCLLLIAAAPAATPYSRMDQPWWKARFLAKQTELHQGRVDVLWLGDSITQQFETAGPEAWRDFTPVWDRYYAPRHAVNLGFRGDATAHLLWRIENGETDGLHPRLAIILIGANNFGHLHWPAPPTLLGIEAIVDVLHRRLPETKILLLSVLPSIRSAWVDQNTSAVNAALAARYGDGRDAMFVDLTRLFLRGGRVDPAMFIDPHLTPPDPPLHPTAQSMARLAATIEPVVSRLLEDQAR